jgi:protein gp37
MERRAMVAEKKKFNYVNENIDWAKWSWNPVTGCEHGCVYCYARDIANRFYEEKFKPTFHEDRLGAPANTTPKVEPGGNLVFVCSMADLFGDWVPDEWIEKVLEQVRATPHWTFLFLTKNPKRYIDIDWPINSWAGATTDTQERVEGTLEAFKAIKHRPPVLFVSCEPLLEPLDFHSELSLIDWIIIGAQSRGSNCPEFQPEWKWVASLLTQAESIKAYCKPNLQVLPRERPWEV